MWPFSKPKQQVKEEFDINARPLYPGNDQEGYTFEEISKCPVEYGMVMRSRLEIGIGRWPTGTPKLSRLYYDLYHPKMLMSDLPYFKTYDEALDFLLDHEQELLKSAFCLSPDVLEMKAKRILLGKYPKKEEGCYASPH